MEERRVAAAGRLPARSGHPGADFPQGARALPEGGRQVSRPDSERSPGPTPIPHNPSLAEVAKEINGKALADITDDKTKQTLKSGQQLPSFAFLRDDGTTSCGNWIYSGCWTDAGPQLARRGPEDPSGLGIYPNWAWSLAGESPRALQPRFLRSGGQAVGSPTPADLVE